MPSFEALLSKIEIVNCLKGTTDVAWNLAPRSGCGSFNTRTLSGSLSLAHSGLESRHAYGVRIGSDTPGFEVLIERTPLGVRGDQRRQPPPQTVCPASRGAINVPVLFSQSDSCGLTKPVPARRAME
jgi:hypothetical protein